MRVGFFSDTYLPAMHGVTTSIRDFGEELVKRGHEVHLYAPSVDREYDRGMKVHSCKSFNFYPYPGMRSALALQMKIPELDIIHAQSPVGLGWYALKIADKRKLPKVATYHTLLPEYSEYIFPFAPKIGRKIIDAYLHYFFNKFDRMISPSIAVKNYVKGLKVPVEIIPSGINLSTYKRVENAKQKLGVDGIVYLSLCRLGFEKNIDIIINACKKLDTEFTLFIAGKGPMEADLKKLAGNDRRIKFEGYVPEEEINTYYSAADFFINASDTETQGLTTLEAMACKTPVIAADGMANPEQVFDGKNGYLFRSAEKDSLLSVLRKAKRTKELSDNAYHTAESLSVPKMTDKLEKLYEEVIEEHKKRAR